MLYLQAKFLFMKHSFVLFILFVISHALDAQSANLTGSVTDIQGQRLNGATIHILNTTIFTLSDPDGKFQITNLPKGKYILEVTAVGFASFQNEIVVDDHQDELTVQLHESTTQLDPVVVTAQKTEEEAQKIPAGISTLSGKQVQQYRLWNLRDITAIVPNLYAADPGDNRNVTSIRGIASTSYDPAVATYVDGVNQFGLDTYIAQLFDVERIEVLRGPQGTLYGRNAMGGVINVVTKQPTNVTSGFVETNIGTFGQHRYSLGVRTPLIKNKLFFGVSGVYDETTGFYTDQYNHTPFDKKHSLTGSYYLKWIPGKSWVITLNAKHNNNRNNGAFTLAGTVQDALANPYVVNQNATTQMVDNIFNSSATAAYAGSKFNFSSQTTYQSNYRYYENPIDGDFSPIDGVTIINNYGKSWNNVKVLTQEFRLTSPANASSPLRWTAGSYLYRQQSPVKQATRFGADAKYVGAQDSLFSIINTSTSINTGAAFFGQASYTIASALEFTAGLRYDYERKQTQALSQYQHDPNPNPIFDIRPDTSATVSYHALSPKATLAYTAIPDHLLYGTFSRGFRTGGLTGLSADPSQAPLYSYKPEYSNNFEIGIKNIFLNNRLRINLAAFAIEVTDAQVPTLVLPAAITVIRNTGSLSSRGVELELAATPWKGLQVDYTFGVNNAHYNSLKVSQNGQNIDLGGNRQIFTPASTSMLALQYQSKGINGSDFRLALRGEWMHLGRQYFDLANTIQQDQYNLLNARIGVIYKNFELMLWGRNLGETKYIAYAYDFGATHLGNPRTYGSTLRINF